MKAPKHAAVCHRQIRRNILFPLKWMRNAILFPFKWMRNTILFPLKWMMREHSTNVMFDRLNSRREIFERTNLEQLYEEICHRNPSS